MIVFSSAKPIFIQIADFYKDLINRGALKENDMLPSVRDVAIEEGVNPNTVEKSFTLLVNDGYVRNIPKKGFFVSKAPSKTKEEILEGKIETLTNEGFTLEEISSVIEKMKGENND